MPNKKIKTLPKSYMVNGNIVKVERVFNPTGVDIIQNLIIYFYLKEKEQERMKHASKNTKP